MLKQTIRTTVLCLSAAFLVIGFSSCKKDKEKSRTELLTQAAWKIVKDESRTGSGGAWVDNTASYAACEKDNLLNFLGNGTYEFNEGATKCAPADPQVIDAGTWAFTTNETKLTVTPVGSSASSVDIEQLDGGSLVVTSSYTSGGTTYYDRQTFGH